MPVVESNFCMSAEIWFGSATLIMNGFHFLPYFTELGCFYLECFTKPVYINTSNTTKKKKKSALIILQIRSIIEWPGLKRNLQIISFQLLAMDSDTFY